MNQKRVCKFRFKGRTSTSSRADTPQHDEQPLIPDTKQLENRTNRFLRTGENYEEVENENGRTEHMHETEVSRGEQDISTSMNTPRSPGSDKTHEQEQYPQYPQEQYPQYPQDHPTIPPLLWHLYEVTGRSSQTWWRTHPALRPFRPLAQPDGPQWQDPFPNTAPLDASMAVDETMHLTAAALEVQNRAALSNTIRMYDDGDPHAKLPENGMVSTSAPPLRHTPRERPLRKIVEEIAAIEERDINRAKNMRDLEEARREHDALLERLRAATLDSTKYTSTAERQPTTCSVEKHQQGDGPFQDMEKQNQLPAHAVNFDEPLVCDDLEELEPLTRSHSHCIDFPLKDPCWRNKSESAIVMRPAGLYQNATTFTSNGKGLATDSTPQAVETTEDQPSPEIPPRSPLRSFVGTQIPVRSPVTTLLKPVRALVSETLTIDEIVRQNSRTAEEVNGDLDREMESFRSRTRGISVSSVVTAIYVGARGQEPEHRPESRLSMREDMDSSSDGHE